MRPRQAQSAAENQSGGVRARILSADVDDLFRWTDRILTAEALGDVFRDEEPDAEAN